MIKLKTQNTGLLFLLILILASFNYGQAQYIQLTPADKNLLDSLAEQHWKDTAAPGMAVGIVSNGKILYAQGFGVKNMKTQEPVTIQSVFHMASVSKTFVATALAKLTSEGKLELDDLLIDHLPYFKLKDERYRQITIRHMLTHKSGIPDVNNYHWSKPKYHATAIEEYVKGLKNKKLDFAPGTQYAYSNTAFNILADVISKVSGMPFEEYMKDNILLPAGMKNSTFYKPDVPEELTTSPHIKGVLGKQVSGIYPYSRIHAGSGTLNSNVEDMMKYAMTYLNKGSIDNTTIFDSTAYRLLTTPTDITWGREIGLSWFITNNDIFDGRLDHSGGDRGYTCWLGILPQKSWSMVVLYNAGWRLPNSDALFE
ncbi:MAG: serine hydrolase domain-containing protein, partial [Bacteroidota bacterium]